MKFNREQLNNAINRVAKDWDMSGGFVVIKDGACVHESVYGFENRELQRPMGRSSKYILHSESTFLVGLCALMLIEQGKLKFSDKLSKYIPEYQVNYAEEIKVVDLLKGTSGIPDFFYNHLMIELGENESCLALSDDDRRRLEIKTYNLNRSFDQVMEIIRGCALIYKPGTSDLGGSESNQVFLAEIVKRVSGMTVLDFLMSHVFMPLGMGDTKIGASSEGLSSVMIKEKEMVQTPLNYPVQGVFTTSLGDMTKLLTAMTEKKILSEKMWKRVLKYDSNGNGMIFENANGFDCGNITFLGFGFYFYFNQNTGLAFASLVNEEQTFRHVGGELRYFRRDSREVIEAAFTYPVNTKMVKLNKSNLWHALSLKVAEDQQGYVLETKSSVAMALMYSTKQAYVEMEGNRAIGLLVLDVNKTKNHYNIDIIIIDEKYQGRGYGKIMLKWAVEKLASEGAKELEIGVNRFNHAAKKIYLDAGFTPKAIYDGGMTLHMVI